MKNQMSIAEQWARMDPNWVEPVDTKGPTPRRVRQEPKPGLMLSIYGDRVRFFVPDVSEDELRWLCNKSGKLYRRIKDKCVDNYRVCQVIDGKTTIDYQMKRAHGCCGSLDTTVTNPKTGNVFAIGFNYGH